MEIIIKNLLVEAHHFNGLVKYYYDLFYQIYNIITAKLPEIKPSLLYKCFLRHLII